MRNRVGLAIAAAMGCCVASAAMAEEKKPDKPYTPATAFAALEEIVGDWVNEQNADGPVGMTAKMTGAGSALATTLFPLIHTHYCALQNQPTMEMVASDQPGVIRFEFVSGTNMDVHTDAHTHNTEFHLLEDGRLKVIVEGWSDDKPGDKQVLTLQRVESKAGN